MYVQISFADALDMLLAYTSWDAKHIAGIFLAVCGAYQTVSKFHDILSTVCYVYKAVYNVLGIPQAVYDTNRGVISMCVTFLTSRL